MKQVYYKSKIRQLIFIASALFIWLSVSSNILGATDKSAAGKKGITGVWQLKKTVTEKKSGKFENFKATKETPESLILAIEEGIDEVTINEGYRQFIYTQTLPTDGQSVIKNSPNTNIISTKAVWEKNRLVVEAVAANGERLTQVFQLADNRRELIVTLQIINPKSLEVRKIRRVYRKVGESEENIARIGITNYPL